MMNAQPNNPFDIDVDEKNQLDTSDIEINEDLFEEIDDNEDENQLFWVIQKTIWGIIKSLFFLLIIGGSIWLIWGNGGKISIPKISLPSIFSSDSVTKKTSETKEIKTEKQPDLKLETRNTKISEKEISTPISINIIEKNPSALLVRWSLWMHRTQTAVAQNEIEKTLKWELGIQNYLGNDILSHIKAPTLFERTKKMSEFENRLQTFQQQGISLANVLSVEHRIVEKKLNNEKSILNNITQQLDSKLESKNYFGFENLLQKKYESAGKIEQFSTETKIRKYLLEDIQKYQSYLNDVENKLIANKAAILSDIKVKPFSNDPFERLRE